MEGREGDTIKIATAEGWGVEGASPGPSAAENSTGDRADEQLRAADCVLTGLDDASVLSGPLRRRSSSRAEQPAGVLTSTIYVIASATGQVDHRRLFVVDDVAQMNVDAEAPAGQ